METTLGARVSEALRNSGCAAFGFAAAESLPAAADERFRRWLAGGNHAGMTYLERHAALRCRPQNVLEEAATVISIAFRFQKPHRASLPVAAYALGRNYHNALKSRLKPIVSLLETSGHKARITVDSAPVAERFWAVKCGIASYGMNGMALVPGCGPYCFLCEILTSCDLTGLKPWFAAKQEELPVCRGCGRCVAACPAGALKADGALDARRCLSYLSIEEKGEVTPPPGVRFPILGCDRCLAACPLPINEEVPVIADFRPREELMNLSAGQILNMTDAELEAFTAGTALRRPGKDALRRNARLNLDAK